jgi:carboxymethylenebutenolidase
MPTKTLQIPTGGGQADAFAAFPEGEGRHPGVLMYADGFGTRPVLRDVARELAGHGYYVLVPNFFYRHGPAPVIELPEYIGEEDRVAIVPQLMRLIEAHTAERVLRDADAYLEFLTAQPEVGVGSGRSSAGHRRSPTVGWVPDDSPGRPQTGRGCNHSLQSWNPRKPTARSRA